ncbi:MAG: hypothetical protein RB191_02225 [Terriglobia bacterium]|nr:hypothetical protein [Terriglobia bacterium]
MGPKSKNDKRKGALVRMERGPSPRLDEGRKKKGPARTEEQRQHEMEILRKVMQ